MMCRTTLFSAISPCWLLSFGMLVESGGVDWDFFCRLYRLSSGLVQSLLTYDQGFFFLCEASLSHVLSITKIFFFLFPLQSLIKPVSYQLQSFSFFLFPLQSLVKPCYQLTYSENELQINL